MKSLEQLRELLANGPSPFELRFASDAWDDGVLASDVPAIHRASESALLRLVGSTARDGRTRAALVLGETGSGKTHVLARLRRATAGRAIFVAASSGAPADVARSFLEAASVDLRRVAPGQTRPQLALLADALVERFARPALEGDYDVVAPHLAPAELDERPAVAARVLENRLAPAIAGRIPECPLELVRALLRERVGGDALEACAPMESFRMLRGLGALGAAAGLPIILSLDQNDAVPATSLAFAITRLHAAQCLVLVATYLRTLWDERREKLLEPERQRAEENRVVIEPPSLAEVLAFVEARLESWRGEIEGPIFPFTPRDLESIATRSGRLLLRDWCRALDALLSERLGTAAPPVVVAGESEEARRALERLGAEIVERLPEGEAPLREALVLALRAARAGDVTGPLDPGAPFDVILRSVSGTTGFKVLDTDSPKALASRLEQILDELDAGVAARAVLLRTREIPAGWKRSQDLAGELRARGGGVHVLGPAERASLHALARLDATSAGLVAPGHPLVQRLVEPTGVPA